MLRGIRSEALLAPRRRLLSVSGLVVWALAACFIVFLALRLDFDLAAFAARLRQANPALLVLAVVAHYLSFLFRGLRWRVLLVAVSAGWEPRPGRLQCCRLVLMAWFANSVAWLRLGDAYRAYLLQEESSHSFSRSIGTLLPERIVDLAAMLVALAVAMALLPAGGAHAAWAVAAGGVFILLGFMVVFSFTLAAVEEGALLGWAGRLPAPVATRLCLAASGFRRGALCGWRPVPAAFIWSLLGWQAELVRLYLVAMALGIDLSAAAALGAAAAASLLALVPTPGGLGAVEAGLAGFLHRSAGVGGAALAALVAVDRSISYASVVVSGGGVLIFRLLRRRLSSAAGA